MLDKEGLLNYKKSDSIVILGSGFSINSISEPDWEKISQVDSIAFNWFCNHHFAPTFYVIREQANLKSRIEKNEQPDILMNSLNRDSYKKTALIVLDVRNHSPGAFDYEKCIKKTRSNYIVLKDLKLRNGYNFKALQRDALTRGVYHGKCSLISVLHIVISMGYKNVYFAGIDLNNSRYFWLSKNTTRSNILKKRKTCKDVHPVAKYTCKFITRLARKDVVNMYVLNRKSLLAKIIPVRNFGEIL